MRFLNETLNIHGIASEMTIMIPDRLKMSENAGFLVKTWSFSKPGRSGNSSFPYFNQLSFDGNYVSNTHYLWGTTVDVQYSAGTPGQNNAKPASLFNNHQFLSIPISGKYYDPSYGITYFTSQDMDNTLSGYYEPAYVIQQYGLSYPCFLIAENPEGCQIRVMPLDEYIKSISAGYTFSIP